METLWKDSDLDVIERWPRSGIDGVRVGTLVTVDPVSGIWVTYADAPDGPVAARSTVGITPDDVGRSLVVVFENGDPKQPIITGLIQDQAVTVSLPEQMGKNVHVDGKRIRLEADKEIVLRCGKSSITLRADGKIVVRGMEIVSRARRSNKVKGGTVQIN